MNILLLAILLNFLHDASLASHGLDGADSFDPGGSQTTIKVGQALPDFIDPNGYVLYCPCMGRFGNQAEHTLGTLSFVKDLNRTFVVPPFIIYPPEAKRNSERVEFKKWFSLKPLNAFHRTITMEEFFKTVAPVVWQKGSRIAHCRNYPGRDVEEPCRHKEGNPPGPFWDHFGVDFDGFEKFDLPFDAATVSSRDAWHERFPGDRYPVIALAGAVGSFPMSPELWKLQKVFQWSSSITTRVKKFLKEQFDNEKFVGVHLRRGSDWENACQHVDPTSRQDYMASPQCTHGTDVRVTKDICFPSETTILKEVKKVMKKTKAKYLFVASDTDPMVKKLTTYLKQLKVVVVTHSPDDLRMDLALLQRAEYFIGNCVSSVSSFVSRHRLLHKKPTSFWAVKS